MKAILIPTALLLLAAPAVVQAQTVSDQKPASGVSDNKPKENAEVSDAKNPVPYVITIPPWVKGYSHAEAKKHLKQWAEKEEATFGKQGLNVEKYSEQETDEPYGGGNSFVADLTEGQADALRKQFRIPQPHAPSIKDRHIIVSKLRDFSPIGGTKLAHALYEPRAVTNANWAAQYVVPNALQISQQYGAPPVLYVVDTGVQPLVPAATTSKFDWHPELKPAVTAGKLRFLQGRVASGVGYWPKSTATPPWNTPSGQPLIFTSSNLKPLPTLASPYNIDPQIDPFVTPYGHGTRVAGTAIGATMGLLGRFTVASAPIAVDVESIRIYKNPPAEGAIISTNSAAVSDGIYKAVNEHVVRGAGARSVLLFASRSTSGFAENVEIALWWAWYKGMIVVVSGGNEPGSASNNDLHAPTCLWYESTGLPTVQSTTPCRFNSDLANQYPQYWPNPTAPGGASIPRPNHVYLTIVGGHNVTYNGAGDYTNTDTWRPSSSRGPDIDISAPSLAVPSISPGTTTVVGIDGTSFSTGFVAGAAVAYLAAKATVGTTTPDDFRSWLLPPGGPSGAPACATSTWTAWPLNGGGHASHYINSAYEGFVPKLLIQTAPTP